MAVVALLSTTELPWVPCHEARYEMRIRDYRKNIDQPEAVLNGLELVDGRALCGWLDSLSTAFGGEVETGCDRTEKITLRVRSADAKEAETTARTLFTLFCDTVCRYADKACGMKAREYSRQIDSLLLLPQTDSIQALVKAFADRRAILLADAAGGVKYIEVLNPAEAGMAHRTAPRLMVILLSIAATLLLCCATGWYVRVAQGAVNRDKS